MDEYEISTSLDGVFLHPPKITLVKSAIKTPNDTYLCREYVSPPHYIVVPSRYSILRQYRVYPYLCIGDGEVERAKQDIAQRERMRYSSEIYEDKRVTTKWYNKHKGLLLSILIGATMGILVRWLLNL